MAATGAPSPRTAFYSGHVVATNGTPSAYYYGHASIPSPEGRSAAGSPPPAECVGCVLEGRKASCPLYFGPSCRCFLPSLLRPLVPLPSILCPALPVPSLEP